MEKERCQHSILTSLPSVKEQTIADVANRESIRICERQLSSLIHTLWQVHVCTPDILHLFPFNISTSQRSTTSLSPHFLGCLVRDLNYGPWQVIVRKLDLHSKAYLSDGKCRKFLNDGPSDLLTSSNKVTCFSQTQQYLISCIYLQRT